MTELPEIKKTAFQALVEQCDPRRRDVREVCLEVWERTGHMESVAAEIARLTGRPISVAALRGWFDAWGWDWRQSAHRATAGVA